MGSHLTHTGVTVVPSPVGQVPGLLMELLKAAEDLSRIFVLHSPALLDDFFQQQITCVWKVSSSVEFSHHVVFLLSS